MRKVGGVLLFAACACTSAVAEEGELRPAMIEVPCQGASLLVFPKPMAAPEGAAIRFVSTWGKEAPYVVVDDRYAPDVIRDGEVSGQKFFGHFVVQGEVESFVVDGCYVDWRAAQ